MQTKWMHLKKPKTNKKTQETKHNGEAHKLLEKLQQELNLIVLTKPSSELTLSCFEKQKIVKQYKNNNNNETSVLVTKAVTFVVKAIKMKMWKKGCRLISLLNVDAKIAK